MRAPLRQILFSEAGFTPRVIFAALQGAWYEAGLNGTLFTTNTGETPASAESTVGLALDKSQGAVLGPELVTNGTFDTNTDGWSVLNASRGTFESVNGRLVATNNGTNATGPTLIQNVITTQGRLYNVTANVISVTGSGAEARLRILADGATSLADFTKTSAGTFNYYFIANRTSTVGVWVYPSGLNAVVVLDNISVREVLGNHASQSTEANRPILKNVGTTWFLRHDATDVLTASLPALSGGNFSTNGSVYFATPVGMSALHGLTIGTTYSLPALSSDIYGSIVVPERLSAAREAQLARYMERLAGIAGPDYFEQVDYGPELVTNGDFSNGTTGWTAQNSGSLSVVSGAMRISNGADAVGYAYQSITTEVGKTYQLTVRVITGSSATASVYVGTSIGGGQLGGIGSISSTRNYSTTFKATTTTTYINPLNLQAVNGRYTDFDNISVRELKDGMTGQLTADDNDLLLAQ